MSWCAYSHAYTVVNSVPSLFRLRRLSRGAQNASEASESRAVLRRAGARQTGGETDGPGVHVSFAWLPYAAVYESAKFLGLQLGLRPSASPIMAGAPHECAARAT